MKHIALLLVLALMASFQGCASILSSDTEVVGVARLEGAPSNGHGGILISNGHVSAISASDGTFTLSGQVLKDTDFDVIFSKDGYISQVVNIFIDYAPGDDSDEDDGPLVVDVGTVTLPLQSK